jgi:dTDP-4-dehydrorhamnose 3,5-epimerase
MVSRFVFTPVALRGLVVVERQRLADARGTFSRLFCSQELSAIGFALPVAQINQTLTRRCGAVRGMHFQFPPHAEDKLVSCLHGQVFDVAVDLRSGSETFLKWHGEILSEENRRSLFIPQGFAHGFQTLTDDCELLYLHSAAYAPGAESALNPIDPAIGIKWPLAFTDISERDSKHPLIGQDFTGIRT